MIQRKKVKSKYYVDNLLISCLGAIGGIWGIIHKPDPLSSPLH